MFPGTIIFPPHNSHRMLSHWRRISIGVWYEICQGSSLPIHFLGGGLPGVEHIHAPASHQD